MDSTSRSSGIELNSWSSSSSVAGERSLSLNRAMSERYEVELLYRTKHCSRVYILVDSCVSVVTYAYRSCSNIRPIRS